MKVVIAQIGTDPGFFNANVEKISTAIDQAKKQNAELIIFPEGAVQGYTHMDLAFNSEFVLETRKSLEKIAATTAGITAIVGFLDLGSPEPGPDGKPVLYNSAAVISNGAIVTIRDKTLLPEYGIFSENRYFTPGTRTGLVDIAGKKVGIGICEDMWSAGYRQKVYPALIEQGADILVNLSASPFHVARQQERVEIIESIVSGSETAFLYCNLVGSYDGYDGEVVFDGQSMVWGKQNSLVAMAAAFKEELLVVDLETATSMPFSPRDEAAELYDALVLGIQEYFRRSGFERAYIGLSGGIDSALVAALATAALGAENVIGVTMPSHITSSETLSDAKQLATNLGIVCKERTIAPEYSAWLAEATDAHGKELHTLTRQNKQARIRGRDSNGVFE